MRTAFFSYSGRVILVSDLSGMGMPPGSLYSAGIADHISANDIYFDTASGEAKEKTNFNLVVTRNRIEQIPAGSRIIFGAIDEIVDDGSVEFLADVEETVTVYLEHFEYKSLMVEVETGP